MSQTTLETEARSQHKKEKVNPKSKIPNNARIMFLTQRKCLLCGNLLLIPTGTCHVCQVCGTSNGCS